MSKSLLGAEILDVGTWPSSPRPLTIGASGLDGIVSTFESLGLSGRVPLKFGHNDKQPLTDGQPALGWVSRLYRSGTKLLADFTDIPDTIFEAIRKGLYKYVSVELLQNVQAGTRVLPWVLDAVALLGADQPAVGTLKDLQALTLKRGPQLRASARVALKRDTKLFSTGAKKAMDEKEVQAAIAAALEAQEKKLTTNFTAQLEKVTATAKAEADAQVAKEKADAHRAQIKAKFESACGAGALVVAKRESFYKFNRVDDDAAVVGIKLEDVDAYIEEYSDKAKLAAANKTQTRVGDKAEHAATYALEVTRRAEELAVKRGGKANVYADVHAATKLVLSADKKLATAYFSDPSGAFTAEAV